MKYRYKNVAHIKSGKNMRWRAAVSIKGKTHNGPTRETAEEAYADALRIKANRDSLGERVTQTLGEGLSKVVEEAEFRGVTASSVEGVYAAPGRALLRWLHHTMPLRSITTEDVCELVRKALAAGRKPTTVKRGYLRVLARALKLSGLPTKPVDDARTTMKAALVDTPPLPKWFAPGEFGRLLTRILDVDRPDTQRVHDLVVVLGHTGIRSGEFSRVRGKDVDIDRAQLHVRTAKDRRRPRTQPLSQKALEALRRLLEGVARNDLVTSASELNHSMYRYQRLLREPRLNGRAIRHTFGTGLVMQGATLPEVRDLLGHHPHSRATVRYLHSLESHRQAAVNRLSDAYEEPSESPLVE